MFPSAIEKMPRPISDIPGNKEVEEGLMKDKEGKHSEAMKMYEKAGKLGNKAAFLNMGNTYMFGAGSFFRAVKKNVKKGIEMYGRCGRIGDGELGWIRELSNDRLVCREELNFDGLLLLINKHITSLCNSFSVSSFLIPYWKFRSMFNRGSVEGEFNSHIIGSGSEDLMIYMMSLDDIYMNL